MFVNFNNNVYLFQFAGLDKLVDIEQRTVMKSSNVDGNVVATKFLDDLLHNLTHRSNENVQFEELFAGLQDLTMSSMESTKNEDKGFNMEFGVLVGCPDKYISHEMNKVATPNVYLVCV
ncbi:hypothetical protein Hdeb2414_s0001g00021321 [Helianthus debilis subsp. tardiflorus]